MMRSFSFVGILVALGIAFSASAALKDAAPEKIAVAEPKVHNAVPATEVSAISDYIESKLNARFQLFSRAALNEMLKEDAFNQSGMVLDSGVQNQLAQQSVDLLLVYSVTKSGANYVVSMRVIDRATGAVRPGMTATFSAADLPHVYARIDAALDRMGLLENPAESVKRVAILPTQGNGSSERIVEGFGTKLATKLQQSALFEIVTRNDLGGVALENQLLTSSTIDPNDLHKISELRAADYLVVTSIPDYSIREISTQTAIAGVTTARYMMSARVEYRIVEVKTGRIIAQGNGHLQLRNTDIPADIRRDWAPHDYNDAFCEYAARWTIKKILDTLDPLVVAAVDGNTLYLSRSSGVFVGETYRVCDGGGKAVAHPKTGRALGQTLGQEIAHCKVSEILDLMAIAQLTAPAAGEIKVGAVCRPDQIADPVAEGNFLNDPSGSVPNYPAAQ